MRIRITEKTSGEWFEFEVNRDSRLWENSSALRQIFNELGLEPPGGSVRYALALETEDGRQVVPDLSSAKNRTWEDLEAKDDDEYYLQSFPGIVPQEPALDKVSCPWCHQEVPVQRERSPVQFCISCGRLLSAAPSTPISERDQHPRKGGRGKAVLFVPAFFVGYFAIIFLLIAAGVPSSWFFVFDVAWLVSMIATLAFLVKRRV